VKKNKSEDILDWSEIGTSKRTNNKENIKVETTKREKPNLKRDVQRLVNWLDNNVLPIVALVVIAGLAVKGLSIYLPEMNETTRTVASILAVALLVVKLQAGKVK
jgi:hypothetical protein